jgi:integrase
MAVIVKERNPGEWWLFINYNGKRKAKKVGSKSAADKARQQIEAKLALGDLGCLDKPKPEVKETTFKEYAEAWLQTHGAKESTINYYRDYLQRYVYPRFGSLKLSSITREQIKTWRGELVAKELSANTVRLATAALRTPLSSAVEDGKLIKNEAFKLPKVRATTAKREPQAMEPEEVTAFLNAAKGYGDYYAPVLYGDCDRIAARRTAGTAMGRPSTWNQEAHQRATALVSGWV